MRLDRKTQVLLWMDKALKKQLTLMAEQNHRSLTQEINYRLEKSINDEEVFNILDKALHDK